MAKCDDVKGLQGWSTAEVAVRHAAAVAGILDTGRAGEVAKRLRPVVKEIARTKRRVTEVVDVSEMSPQEAFDAGREVERAWASLSVARQSFREDWPQHRRKILKAIHD